MTTSLFSLILLTAGGDRMAVTDPHGWTLTLISVTCVFTALIILYFIYTFSGNLFVGYVDINTQAFKHSDNQAIKQSDNQTIKQSSLAEGLRGSI